MRAVILCGGDITDYTYTKTLLYSDDVIICADSGYRHAEQLGVTPAILLGDMDSVAHIPEGIQTQIYPVRKDETDGEIAVRYVIEHGFSEVLLLGCIGNRADHTFTNIFLLRQFLDADIPAVLMNETNEIRMTTETMELSGEIGTIVSVIPLSEYVHICCTKGLSYEAKDLTLRFGTSLGNSNYMIDTHCRIEIDEGLCLIMKSRDA